MRRVIGALVLCLSFTAAAQAQTANLWVDTDGGSCSRSSSPAAYNGGSACGSFSAATAAAASGDTIRVKAGTYGPQSAGHATKTLTYIGEDGTRIDTGSNHNQGLIFQGNATVDNVDVGGLTPFVYFGSPGNNTWQNSEFEEAIGERTCNLDGTEPILLYDDSGATFNNTNLINLVIGASRGAESDTANCGGGAFHLEQVRIDQGANGVLIDRVTFKSCPDGAGYDGCGSGHVFIERPSGNPKPTNITIRNSVFLGSSGSYAIQAKDSENLTLAYNTFATNEPIGWTGTTTNITFVGNLGTRPQNCTSGVTFTKNVWQWASGTPCGTDTRIQGNSFSVDQLGINATTGRLEAGSPAIDAAEDTCASTAKGEDIDGSARFTGVRCDAGADEFGAGGGGQMPATPQNLRIITSALLLLPKRPWIDRAERRSS